jgi:predicted nucleic acid-binding Zn ribbon protein
MRIELKCRECGGNRFTLDHEATDDAHVDCEDCGHKIGTVGELKRQIAEEVMKRARVRDSLSGQ